MIKCWSPPNDTRSNIATTTASASGARSRNSGIPTLGPGGGLASGPYRSLREEGTFSIGEDVVGAYLFSRSIRRLDAPVLTHAHHDHMEGLFDLIRNFEFGKVWLGPNPMVPRYRQLLEQVRLRGILIRRIRAGEQIGPFRVQHPPPEYSTSAGVSNDDSLVLLLD